MNESSLRAQRQRETCYNIWVNLPSIIYLLKMWGACRAKLHIQFNSVHCVYIKYMFSSECCLHLTTKRKGEVLQLTSNILPSYVSVHTHIHTRIRISLVHEPPLLSYELRSPLTNPVPPWTNDIAQGCRRVKRSSAVNQANGVYLSFVDPIHWRPSEPDARILTWARTVDVLTLATNAA
jgi:hypothetical protein